MFQREVPVLDSIFVYCPCLSENLLTRFLYHDPITHMTNQLSSSFVRIFTDGGEIAGAGFLIPEKRILTYADVVARALNTKKVGDEMPTGEVELDFPLVAPGEKFKARAIFWQPGPPHNGVSQWGGGNIAVLEMEKLPPKGPTPVPFPTPTDSHFWTVIDAFIDGQVVAFLGAGASQLGRPPGSTFQLGSPYLPSGGELAEHLARSFRYVPNDMHNLLHISQYVALTRGTGPLYERLRALFVNSKYEVSNLHEFFAKLPAIMRDRHYPTPYQLIVTTNYDDMLERAFEHESVREPYDLVSYVADGKDRGKFMHRRYNAGAPPPEPLPDGAMPPDYMPEGAVRFIEKPNEDLLLSLEQRSVILKIHGAVDRKDAELDSFVITEDHYIDYLTRTDISSLMPATLAAKLRRSHFLFLGYSLRDWNLRVIFYRIWGERKLGYKSWAIQLQPDYMDKEFWKERDVEILEADLEDYIIGLRERISDLKEFQS
jgi:hypothetical protein